jgi:DNA-binding response OmpR family regulator
MYTFVHFSGTNFRRPRLFIADQAGGFALDTLIIMVIEDDAEIQAIIDEALCDGGYEPALAASGEEAITLLRGGQTKYRVLVTDIDLAGRIDGWEVARVAREIDPVFPIIYMTGAAADLWPVKGVPNSLLLTKPFAPAQLVTAISNLLNTGGPPLAPSA